MVTGKRMPDEYGICDRANNCGEKNEPPLPESESKEKTIDQYSDRLIFSFDYDLEIIKQVKTFKNRKWDKVKKHWEVPVKTKRIPQKIAEFALTYGFTINRDLGNFIKPRKAKPPRVFIPTPVLKATLKPEGYERNTFIQNLMAREDHPFDIKDIERVIAHYNLGTITEPGTWRGAITFPFIDVDQRVRTIQVKRFDADNHTLPHGTWFLHKLIENHLTRSGKELPLWLTKYLKDNQAYTPAFVSCPFGEHLLSKYPNNPIALVEAPKTAVYGTLYFGFPDSENIPLWLGVFNLSSLNYERCQNIRGRKVVLFPDLSNGGKAFDLWSSRANELQQKIPSSTFTVSDILERSANSEERKAGLDLGDYLIGQDWRKFRSCHCKPVVKKHKLPENKQKICKVPPLKSDASDANDGPKRKGYRGDTNSKHVSQSPPKKIIGDILVVSRASQSSLASPIEDWTKEVNELESYFNRMDLPAEPWRLNPWTIVRNSRRFVKGSLSILRANNGNRTFAASLEHLRSAKKVIESDNIEIVQNPA